MSTNKQPRKPTTTPESWDVKEWSPTDFPHSAARAKHLIRQYRDELVEAGALVRIGRCLVIIGAPYRDWLGKHTHGVAGYMIPPNRPENEARRFGGRAQ